MRDYTVNSELLPLKGLSAVYLAFFDFLVKDDCYSRQPQDEAVWRKTEAYAEGRCCV